MTDTPTPDRISSLPVWAKDYITWLRTRVTELELEYKNASDEATKLMEKNASLEHDLKNAQQSVRNYQSAVARREANSD